MQTINKESIAINKESTVINEESIKKIARTAVEEVLGYKEDVIREEFDARYRDVKLLMKNYRKLKAHYAHISPETLEVSTICSMRRKTGLMMSHVDKMLLVYSALCRNCEKSEEERRWNALYFRYIADERLTIDEIIERLAIDRRTFYRDMNKAMEDMAVLLFGIEAIGTWKHKR